MAEIKKKNYSLLVLNNESYYVCTTVFDNYTSKIVWINTWDKLSDDFKKEWDSQFTADCSSILFETIKG